MYRHLLGLGVLTGALLTAVLAASSEPARPPTATSTPAPPPVEAVSVYAPDSHHLWNRLFRALIVRRSPDGQLLGLDEPDPPLWPKSTHLLAGPSHERVMAVLDEFLANAGETAVADPVEHAVLQSDLWAVFDWSAADDTLLPQRRELQQRLARAIARLALSPDAIAGLPDNYAQAVASGRFPRDFDPAAPDRPFLPPDLLDPHGPWVNLAASGDLIAHSHTQFVSGRSIFRVLLHLPGDRAATLKYLQQLRSFPKPWVLNPGYPDHPEPVLLNPGLPQFPEGTAVALLRQMAVIDNGGTLRATPLVQSLQIRVYRRIDPAVSQERSQAVFEYRVSRAALFAREAGGLRPVGRAQSEFPLFSAPPEDPLENPRKPTHVLQSCTACHRDPGVYSFESYAHLLQNRSTRPPALYDTDGDYIATTTLGWKRYTYSWGLLQGLTQSGESASLPHSADSAGGAHR